MIAITIKGFVGIYNFQRHTLLINPDQTNLLKGFKPIKLKTSNIAEAIDFLNVLSRRKLSCQRRRK